MTEQQPHIIVIAGPNGSGKSTTAPSLLKGTLGVTEFVNADVIAEGLSAFQPEGAAFHAGRIWRLYNNSIQSGPDLIAAGGSKTQEIIYKSAIWSIIKGEHQ